MSKEILGRHWDELKSKPNVLNVAVATKFKGGQDTKTPSITVYVSKKVASQDLPTGQAIPKEIEGVLTDVIEIAPQTWKAGPTTVSTLKPEEQRRRAAMPPRERKFGAARPKALSGEREYSSYCSPIQDQGNCGSCVAFGEVSVMEACIRIDKHDTNFALKLSEAHAFFCSGGGCGVGNTPERGLNRLLKGVCSAACLPYKDEDQACAMGICDKWWETGYRLKTWRPATGDQVDALLETKPLNATMAVHQSFMNYQGGVYENLGAVDPIIGYHDIACMGKSQILGAYFIRNSWGEGWGGECQLLDGTARPGYCWVKASELDPEMQELVPDLEPVPYPNPVIMNSTLPDGQVGVRYSESLVVSGGTPPFIWGAEDLPPGLALNGARIDGTPTVSGSFACWVVVSDSEGGKAVKALNIIVAPAPVPPPKPRPWYCRIFPCLKSCR